MITVPHDVDRKTNGNTLICSTTFGEMFEHIGRTDEQILLDTGDDLHRLIEVDVAGNTIWEKKGLGIPHEVLEIPNSHLLVADTSKDRIIEINYPNKDIVWSWEPKQINWTQVNSNWASDHYYNNPITYDFTHMNDVEFKNYGNWDACLISIRNFDLVVEVNYTAEISGTSNNPDNIVWWFGDYGDHSLINKQHNPDYLSNGNIIIADSQNNRIIEVNKTTKGIIWTYDEGLRWPRDADELENGRILITDCFNNRIIEIDKDTKDILWKYSKNILIPYEADMLDNGNILISGDYGGKVIEVNRAGKTVWQYGKSAVRAGFYMNSTLLFLICLNSIIFRISSLFSEELTKKKKRIKVAAVCLLSIPLFLSLFIMAVYHSFMRILIKISYSAIGHEMF
ncbi:MAG: outer membrane protein assembly factor BamB family protein [Candidatus Heimdallarchaeaceae archaeon]